MTVTAYPLDAVSGAPSYTGRMLRDTIAALFGGASTARPLGVFSGARPGTPLTTVTLSGLNWTCHPCAGVIDAESAAEAGPYLWSVLANETGTLNVANGSNPRIDILSVQISDPAESDGTSAPGAALVYTPGTPAASPAAASTPARALKLVEFQVPKTGSGSPTVTWVAPWLYAAGAPPVVPTIASLTTVPGYDGAPAFVVATPGALWRYNATSVLWEMQGTAVFADASARDTAIPSPLAGMEVYLTGVGATYRRIGTTWAKHGAPFAAFVTPRTATSTVSVASPTVPATLPTTPWTAVVTPLVPCRAKVSVETYITAAAGGVDFGFTLSGGVTLAFDEFTPGGGSSAAAYGQQNTGLTTFSKIVDIPAAATTITVVARQAGSAGAKTVGAGRLTIEPVMS